MPPTLFHDIDPERLRANLAEVSAAAAGRAEVLVACKYVPVEEMGGLGADVVHLQRRIGRQLALDRKSPRLDIGIERVLRLDDRDERAGVKFKDADLIGIPYRINIGKKTADGRLELVTRSTASSQDVGVAEIVERVKEVAGAV